MSGASVSGARNKWLADIYLIIYHCITDIFDQTAKFIRILDIAKETLNLPLLCQWLEF